MRLPALVAALQLLWLSSLADAAMSTKKWSLCWRSCGNCLDEVPFSDVPTNMTAREKLCRSNLSLASHYLCIQIGCGEHERIMALDDHQKKCRRLYGVEVPSFELVANYTQTDIDKLPLVKKDDVLKGKSFNTPVLPSRYFFKIWFDTLEAAAFALWWSIVYGHVITLFWVGVVALGIVNKAHLALMRYRSLRRLSRLSPIIRAPQSWFKRKIVLPATFGYRCAQSVWWSTIPPRIQSLTIFAFLTINVFFTITGYKVMVVDNLYFGSPFLQMTRYLSDRTGTISFINFPMLWLFGMRNNFAMWLTGWDFATYNNFHRWIARIATVEAVIHTIGYTILVLENGGMTYLLSYFEEWWWNAGCIAMVAMGALIPLSIYWLRRRHYETFLILHIALSAVLLLTMLGHVSIFSGEFDILFWVPMGIWVLDRVARLLRILDFGRLSFSVPSKVEYDENANVVRLSVPLHPDLVLRPKPGVFYNLMVLNDKHWWQSHPFTVASIEEAAVSDSNDSDEHEHLIRNGAEDDGLPEHIQNEKGESQMTFLIRPYNGFTARLRDLAMASANLNVVVEGPYGHSRPLNAYSHVVFIAGGTGVVGPLSYLPILMSAQSAVKTVELHWAVRELELYDLVVKDYLHMAQIGSLLTVDIYTSSHGDQSSRGALPANIQRHYKRPSTGDIVSGAVSVAQGSDIAVLACGPEGMLDDARFAVVQALATANCHIDYYQENFAW